MDAIAGGGRMTPFEVKYRAIATGAGNLKGLTEFYDARKVEQEYVITKDIRDFGVLPLPVTGGSTLALKVPAALGCYWLGRSELEQYASPEAS